MTGSAGGQRERKEDNRNLRQDPADQHDARPVASPALGLAKGGVQVERKKAIGITPSAQSEPARRSVS
jgi:hypothetical protein